MIFRSEFNEKYEPPTYSDIKNNYIEKPFYKTFIKAFNISGKEDGAYDVVTHFFNERKITQENPSFELIMLMKKIDINCNERLSELNMNDVISKSVCNSDEDKSNESKNQEL